jgi:hypothetical protein
MDPRLSNFILTAPKTLTQLYRLLRFHYLYKLKIVVLFMGKKPLFKKNPSCGDLFNDSMRETKVKYRRSERKKSNLVANSKAKGAGGRACKVLRTK